MRRLAIAMNDLKVARVEMTVCPDVDFYLQNKKRAQIAAPGRAIRQSESSFAPIPPSRWTKFGWICSMCATRRSIWKTWEWRRPAPAHPAARPGRQGGGRFRPLPRGPRDDDRQRGGQPQRPHRQPPRPANDGPDRDQDHFDIDSVEDDLDRRDRAKDEEETESTPQPSGDIEQDGSTAESPMPAPGKELAVVSRDSGPPSRWI